eukprot:15477004-Alexandrium_andersonii.AAC.1
MEEHFCSGSEGRELSAKALGVLTRWRCHFGSSAPPAQFSIAFRYWTHSSGGNGPVASGASRGPPS